MLILSRRADETIVFPGLGISVQILRSNSSTVKLGIDAPNAVSILRGELADKMEQENLQEQADTVPGLSNSTDDVLLNLLESR